MEGKRIMEKILITGGAGFIGSHLCRELVKQNNIIYCLDNFFTGKKENIQDLINLDNFNLIEYDIINSISIDIDKIYHLACPASPVYYQYDPIYTLKTNIFGAFNLLELAKKNNARILFSSTSEVYGDPLEHPQKESYWGNVNPIGHRAMYDEGKRVAETIFMEYYRKYNVDIRLVRIFNTYGPFMRPDDGRVISNFSMQALKNDPITVYGNGSQTRSFCHIDDMINGLLKVMEGNYIGPFNLGNDQEYKILDVAKKIMRYTQTDSQIEYKKLPSDDPTIRRPDLTNARVKLKWSPIISFEDGLKYTVDYFRKLI